MIGLLRAEWLKQRSIWSPLLLLACMVGLVVLIVALHGKTVSVRALSGESGQFEIAGQGERLGILFGALLGAMSMTTEFRHGTIRPLLLATPNRGCVLLAKILVAVLIGGVFGLVAAAVSTAVADVALSTRSIAILLTQSDVTSLWVGSAVGAALWAGIGVGLGAAARNQAAIMVALCTWLLFIEGVLFEAFGVGKGGWFLPGSLAREAIGQDSAALLAPGPAMLLLCLYVVVVAAVGWIALSRRDVA